MSVQQSPGVDWRSFRALLGMQILNAFNDNVAKFLLIPMSIALVQQGVGFSGLEHVLGILLILPFVLLAPLSGWLADTRAKNEIVVGSAWFQLVVLALFGGVLWWGSRGGGNVALAGAVGCFLLLAIQSALLSPAKMGLIVELMGRSRLGLANGLMEGTVILAILSGQIFGGVAFDRWGLQQGWDPWRAACHPVWLIGLGGWLSLWWARQLAATPVQSQERLSRQVLWAHGRDLRALWQSGVLRRLALGLAFFWGYGGFLQYVLLQVGRVCFGSGEGLGQGHAVMWGLVVGGIALGSVLASLFCRRGLGKKLLPVGLGGMAGGTVLLATQIPFTPDPAPGFWGLLVVCGAAAALFFVPLNALFQHEAPDAARGRFIAASNLLNNLAGILAVAGQFVLQTTGVPLGVQLGVVALGAVVFWRGLRSSWAS